MTQLGDEELWAKGCIEQALPEFAVEQHDDGSRPGMYDLKIVYPNDQIGAVEITAAADAQQIELWKLIGGRGKRWLAPKLAGGWVVEVRPSARARDLHRHLPDLLHALERDDTRAIRTGRSATDRLAALAGRLDIIQASQGPTAHPGSIYVLIERPLAQMGGYSPTTGDPLAVWLGQWLSEPSQADNIRKLANSNARERHVFILVPEFTPAPFAVIDLLAASGAPMPTIPPVLPSEITHVWTMSMWTDWDDAFPGLRGKPRAGYLVQRGRVDPGQHIPYC
jgi:hypothetical protein